MNNKDKIIAINSRSTFKSNPSILAQDLKIEGEVTGLGIIEIEGLIKGSIKGSSVIIRETGNIEGDIFAENLIIKGTFNGKIKASNINIASKAKVTGLIEYGSLCVEDGASIDGQFKKTGNSTDRGKTLDINAL